MIALAGPAGLFGARMTTKGPEYAEIATYLRGRFRTLRGPDDQALAAINTLPSGPGRDEFTAASPLPEAVTRFLVQLDAKVDAILAGIHASSIEADFPHGMEIHTISASHIAFITDMPLAPGDWLEVIVNFRQTGIATASGVGKITTRNIDKDGVSVFSLSFTRIAEDEREKIIHYVFQEERRLLRKTRLE